ncbi:DNA polymerase IV [Candidatus Protochlamydia amoebophila]|uniref:DNA polymerase IV n=1 Tax=Candidatus Protochlamydia amoebophila TaxID=362787 RepID=A0A0C1GZA3_9BACT|nr:DNA polymerase IV [Candidatus Protochlamydia amoebophila]
MPSWKAKQLCPDLIILFPDFDKYKRESKAIHEIFHLFTDLIEPLSLDEAFLDVTDVDTLRGSATWIAQEIRQLIWKERGLTASAGVAPNKFLAKVASDWHKPNGQFVLTPKEVDAFMVHLPVEKIFGIGHVMAKKITQFRINELRGFTDT